MSLVRERMLAFLAAFFAALALLLACIGLYGVMAYRVARRTREIGIRIAVGARQHRVVWMMVRETLVLVAIGAALGTLASLGVNQVIAGQLFGVTSRDPAAIVVALSVLGCVTLIAGLRASPSRQSHRSGQGSEGGVTKVGRLRRSGLPQGVGWIDPERAPAGPMQASRHAASMTADVIPRYPAKSGTSSAGRPEGPCAECDDKQQKGTSGCDAAPHEHHGAGQDSGEQMARVGAERRAQPDFARPPRDADGHQREDAQRRQKQDERGHRHLRSDSHDQVHIPLPDPFVQRLRLLDEQRGIDIGRNDRQTRGECGRIAAHAHTHHERRDRSRRRRVKHIRQLVALVVGVQAEVAHDAHDLEPRLRR